MKMTAIVALLMLATNVFAIDLSYNKDDVNEIFGTDSSVTYEVSKFEVMNVKGWNMMDCGDQATSIERIISSRSSRTFLVDNGGPALQLVATKSSLEDAMSCGYILRTRWIQSIEI